MGAKATHEVSWHGRLTLRNVQDSGRVLAAAIADFDGVVLDCGEVESLDASHLQVMIGAHRMAAELGKQLEIRVPEAGAVDTALTQIGIANALDARLLWQGRHWTGIDFAKAESA